MNLRNKLPLSFIIFIAALVALGVWSALSLGLRSGAAATSRGRESLPGEQNWRSRLR